MGAIDPDHKMVLVRVPHSYTPDTGDAALYEAVRKWWVVAAPRRDGSASSPDYALPVQGGRVLGAFRIHGWEPDPQGSRWGFHGVPAPELATRYTGTDVREYFPHGAANPLRFVHCTPRTSEPSLEQVRATPPRSVQVDLQALVAQISAEPLAHLMFGHRELFHSNLLAWCFEHLPEIGDKIWRQLSGPGNGAPRAVLREWQHLDLVFTWPDRRPLVIENKVFSLPDEAQLAGYASLTAAQLTDPALVLLSLHDPGWPDPGKQLGGGHWHRVGYDWLADAIEGALPAGTDSYESTTLRRYAGLIRNLSRLAAAVRVVSTEEPVALPQPLVDALAPTQLAGTMSKLRARHISHLIAQALEEQGLPADDTLSDFTRGQTLIQWSQDLTRDGQRVCAGWQLQGQQFRRFVILPHLAGNTPQQMSARAQFAATQPDLFDFAPSDDALTQADQPALPLIGPKNAHGFNRYNPDFVYRYKKVPDLRVDQLIAAAVAVAKSLTP